MQRTRNGGAAAPAIGRRIVDFEFALAAEAADNVDFPAHLGHRHLGAGGGHWGADDPTANALGEGRSSEQGTAGQQHAADERYELAPLHLITSSARMEVEVETIFVIGSSVPLAVIGASQTHWWASYSGALYYDGVRAAFRGNVRFWKNRRSSCALQFWCRALSLDWLRPPWPCHWLPCLT